MLKYNSILYKIKKIKTLLEPFFIFLFLLFFFFFSKYGLLSCNISRGVFILTTHTHNVLILAKQFYDVSKQGRNYVHGWGPWPPKF